MTFEEKDYPGLFQATDYISKKEQKKYFRYLLAHLTLLIIGAFFAFYANNNSNSWFRIISAILFLASLSILIWQKFIKSDDIWYNGRAVAESVKTRTWRWMMRAKPYLDCDSIKTVRKEFINDLKNILKQNESIAKKLNSNSTTQVPITKKMIKIRELEYKERYKVYREQRITNQELWYSKKTKFNKRRANIYFTITIIIYIIILFLLLYNISEPEIIYPIGSIVVIISSISSWTQAKKYNELSSSYSLATHEIVLIKAEIDEIETEEELSDYVINCENAFSREHTQWYAKRNK